MEDLQSTIDALRSSHPSDFSSLWYDFNKRDDIIIGADSNLTAIGSYVNQIEERISSLAVARRNMAIREERCAESELETSQMGG